MTLKAWDFRNVDISKYKCKSGFYLIFLQINFNLNLVWIKESFKSLHFKTTKKVQKHCLKNIFTHFLTDIELNYIFDYSTKIWSQYQVCLRVILSTILSYYTRYHFNFLQNHTIAYNSNYHLIHLLLKWNKKINSHIVYWVLLNEFSDT